MLSDETKGIGTGYDNYRAGWLRIDKQNNSLVVTAEPISKVYYRDETEIEEVRYKFHSGKEDGDLYDDMNCGSGGNPSRVVVKGKGSLKDGVEVQFDVKMW